jgi:hypothetical protein
VEKVENVIFVETKNIRQDSEEGGKKKILKKVHLAILARRWYSINGCNLVK